MDLELDKTAPDSSDWATNTSDEMANVFRETMAYYAQYADEPYVGIFWYDVENKELFGVKSVSIAEAKYRESSLFSKSFVKTCTTIHKNVWKKESYRGKDKRFQGDYTKVPRGRVFEVKDKGFYVCVGSWINDYPEAKDEIIFEFQLPKDKTQFKIDIHCEIGHGWSERDI